MKICSVVLELLYTDRWMKGCIDRYRHGETCRGISVTSCAETCY